MINLLLHVRSYFVSEGGGGGGGGGVGGGIHKKPNCVGQKDTNNPIKPFLEG